MGKLFFYIPFFQVQLLTLLIKSVLYARSSRLLNLLNERIVPQLAIRSAFLGFIRRYLQINHESWEYVAFLRHVQQHCIWREILCWSFLWKAPCFQQSLQATWNSWRHDEEPKFFSSHWWYSFFFQRTLWSFSIWLHQLVLSKCLSVLYLWCCCYCFRHLIECSFGFWKT